MVPNFLILFSGFLFGLVITNIRVFMAILNLLIIYLLPFFTAGVPRDGLTLYDTIQLSD